MSNKMKNISSESELVLNETKDPPISDIMNSFLLIDLKIISILIFLFGTEMKMK